MNKSIYENAIGLLLKIQGRLSTDYDKFLEVKQALEKAKKQDKLLELYKEVNNKSEELIALAEHDSWSWRLYHEIKVIQDKIKEL